MRKIRLLKLSAVVLVLLLFASTISWWFKNTYTTVSTANLKLALRTGSVRYVTAKVRNVSSESFRQYTGKLEYSLTTPPYYPLGGTGVTVNISGKFDLTIMDLFCQKNTDLRAIVPIYSACGNFERRAAIRKTQGLSCALFNCKIFFILAVSLDEDINEQVKMEMELERDILMIDKIDTYRDLNNKAYAMLKWLVEFCPGPRYVIHAIDDAYTNIAYFLQQMDAKKEDNYFFGSRLTGMKPSRNRGGKLYQSIEEYPYETLPTYIAGCAYSFPNSHTKTILKYIHKADYCWVEDFWLTGHVALKSGTKLIGSPARSTAMHPQIASLSEFLFIHHITANEFYELFTMFGVDFSKRPLRNETFL